MKKLYREPNPEPGRVASRIVSALDAETRAELSGLGVASCLSKLLNLSREVAAAGLSARALTAGLPPLLAVSEAVRSEAEREIAREGLAGRFTDLALNALGTATLQAGSRGDARVFDITSEQLSQALTEFTTGNCLHELSLCFVGHDLDHVFRYFVSRDIADFVGTPALPRNVLASQLRDAVGAHCRETVAGLAAAEYEQPLQEALAAPLARLDLLQAALADLTELSLHQLAVGE